MFTKKQLKIIFDTINDGVVFLDKLGKILYVNKKTAEIFGGLEKELVGKHFTKIGLFSITELPALIHNFVNALAGKKAYFEISFKNKKGQQVFVECSTSLLKIGGSIGIMSLIRDVTERKQAEEVRRESEDKFKNLTETTSDWIWECDKEGRYTYVSPRIKNLLGYEVSEVLGKTPFDFIAKDEAEKKGKIFGDIVQKKEPFSGLENWNVHKNGTKVLLETSGVPILDEKGNLKGYRGIDRDITERKQVEEKLKIFSKAVENAYDSFVLTDMNGNVTYANESAIKIFGYSPEEIMKLNVAQFTANPEDAAKIIKEMKTKRKWDGEVTQIRKNKESFSCLLTTSIFTDDKGNPIGMMGIFRDITEQKNSENKFKEYQEQFGVIFDHSNDGILLADVETKIFSIGNNRICKMLGYSPEEIQKLSVADIHPKEDLPYVLEQFEKQTKGEIEVAANLPVKRKDGSVFYADVNTSLITLAGKRYLLGLFRDITERKCVEENMALLNQKNDLILSSLTEGILGLDLQGNHTFINHAAAKMLGYKAEELIDHPSHSMWHHTKPDGSPYPKEDCMIYSAYRDGKTHRSSTDEFWRKDGTHFPVEYVSTPITHQGLLKGAVVTFHDITERKSAEEQLKYKTVILEAESEASIDGILIVDEYGKTLLTNKRFQEMWGIPQEILDSKDDEKMLQHVAFKLSNPDEFVAKVKYLYDHRDEKSMEEISFKDGNIFDRYSAPLLDLNHKYLGRIWYFHDQTAIKQAEIKLREEKAKLEKYFDVIGIIALVLNIKGDILLMNKRGCEILGYQPDELVGKNWTTDFLLKDKKSKPDNFLEELTKEGSDNKYFEHSVITKDGKEKNITWGSVPILDEAGDVQAFMCAGEDITTLRQAEVTITQLQEFDRLKDEFLNIAAHELKTPLTSIIGLSEIIKMQKASLPPQMAEYPEIIYNEGLRLSHVIKRILTITRYESGKEEVHLESINLTTLILSLLPGLNILSKDKKITIATNLTKENLQIESDKEMISEVIINLVDNSIKYGSENNTITISACRGSDIDEGMVRINIADQGPGIPPDSIDKLFNKFSQLEPSLSRSQEGTGLGLYICKLIVEKLGGRIGVDSEVGKGSTFHFTLPTVNAAI